MVTPPDLTLTVHPALIGSLGIEGAVIWAAIAAIRGVNANQILTVKNEEFEQLLPDTPFGLIRAQLDRLMEAGYLHSYRLLDRKVQINFPVQKRVESTAEMTPFQQRGPAPVFGGRRSNLYHSPDESEREIFQPAREKMRSLIRMTSDWEPGEAFYEQFLTSRASTLSREEFGRYLAEFRLWNGEKKPEPQSVWESKLFNWLHKKRVFKETDEAVQKRVFEERVARGVQGSAVSSLYDIDLDDVE